MMYGIWNKEIVKTMGIEFPYTFIYFQQHIFQSPEGKCLTCVTNHEYLIHNHEIK